jgi:hypothetical protein
VSGLSTLVMSEICATSSLAATRGDVLAAGGGREQDVAVVAGNGQHLRRDVLGQAVFELRAVGVDHLGHAGDLAGRLGGFTGVGAGDQHVDFAAAGDRRRDGVQGRARMDALSCSAMTRAAIRSPWLHS